MCPLSEIVHRKMIKIGIWINDFFYLLLWTKEKYTEEIWHTYCTYFILVSISYYVDKMIIQQ